tara:strand:+ start:923 stop:1375 length:453 start_codon:yes stop_codon:yes gene_type:complete
MPKPKPDNIVRHEIVLGRSERQLIEDGLLAYQINRISTPLVALLSDASAMGLIFAGLGTYYGFKFDIIPNAAQSTADLYNNFKAQYDAAKETATDIQNDPFGSLISLIGSLIPGTGATTGRIDPVTGEPVAYPYGPTTPLDTPSGTPRPY